MCFYAKAFSQNLAFNDPQLQSKPGAGYHSPVLMGTTNKAKLKKIGIVTTSVGVAAGITGLVMYIGGAVKVVQRENQYDNQVAAAQSSGSPLPQQPDNSDLAPRIVGGALLMSFGGVAVTTGMVMILIGVMPEKDKQKVSLNIGPRNFKLVYTF